MYILYITILGFFYGFFNRIIGNNGVCNGIILGLISGLIYCIYIFKNVCLDNMVIYWEYQWFTIGNYSLSIDILIDQLTILMIILILLITILVMIYSKDYMKEDLYISKFMSYLSLFCFCMLFFVTSGNFIQLFIGWEGVGLSSYLLITYWSTRNAANKAAIKAIVVNRIGDVCFIIAIAIMGVIYKSFDFSIIFINFPNIDESIEISLFGLYNIECTRLIAICLTIAAFAKSAQIFLHTWLPDAMEGPTPVSSLLHSATMVTAGIFLILRCSPIFSNDLLVCYIITIIGIMTSLISGIIGAMQYDLKKIIAYSTCSQLGFMFFGVGLGYYNYALFHLITHAIFKCLLFLCSGSIIHAMGEEQDIRKMGNLIYYLPTTGICMLIGTLSLIGFPMFSGYYSKEILLLSSLCTPVIGSTIYLLGVISVFLTSCYSGRVLYFCFFNKNCNISKVKLNNLMEASKFMLIPMIILSILSIISGFFLKEILTGPDGLIFMQNSIYISPSVVLFEVENLNNKWTIFPLLFSLIGLIIVFFYYSTFDFFKKSFVNKYLFINISKIRFSLDNLYNLIFVKSIFEIGYFIYKEVDRGILEIYGPTGLYKIFNEKIKNIFLFFFSGNILYIILSIIIVFNIFLLFL